MFKYEEEQGLVASIKSGASDSVQIFYQRYRQEFVRWAIKTYQCSEEEAIDFYQDSIVIMYENIMSGKLTQLDSKLKTYLFAIGKNLILKNSARKIRNEVHAEEIQQLWGYGNDDGYDDEIVERIGEEFKRMAEPCRSLLYLYYYKNLSMKSIAAELGYKNDDVVKSQKVRCLKALRDIFSKTRTV